MFKNWKKIDWFRFICNNFLVVIGSLLLAIGTGIFLSKQSDKINKTMNKARQITNDLDAVYKPSAIHKTIIGKQIIFFQIFLSFART